MFLLAVRIGLIFKLGEEAEAFLLLAVKIPIFKLDGRVGVSVSLCVWKGKGKEKERERNERKEGKGNKREKTK